ncbi:MAG: hypothetical protein NTW20_06385, partial [Rhodobacterales bacterium]|nr:hypothetical protein [Rhodobacterales bacterium]
NISFTIIKVNDASARTREARSPRPSMAVTRPKRLTTVVTDPMVLPLNIPQIERIGQPAAAREAEVPQDRRRAIEHEHDSKAVALPDRSPNGPETIRPAPVVSVVSHEGVREDTGTEDLTPVRLRPRRVIVIK